MKTWQKIGVVFLGSGIVGALAYSTSLFPNNATIFIALATAVSAITASLTGFSPKGE